MNRYEFDIKQIEKLLVENAQRKNRLREKNSRKLLILLIFFICVFFTLYQN